MPYLAAVPTFGMEFPDCHARFHEERVLRQLGIAGITEVAEEHFQRTVDSSISAANYAKMLGYVPIAGTVVGAIKLHSVRRLRHPHIDNRAAFVFRSIVELLSLGCLFALPDGLVTCARMRWARHQGRVVHVMEV